MPNLDEYSGAAFTEDERRMIRRTLEKERRWGWGYVVLRNTVVGIAAVGAAILTMAQGINWLRGG